MKNPTFGAFKVRVPFKATVVYAAASIITKGIGLLTTPIYTRLLSEEEYAYFPLFLTWLGLLGAFCQTDAAGALTLSGLQRFSAERERFVKAAIGFGLAEVAFIGTAFALGFPLWSSFSFPGWGFLAALLIQLVFDTVTHAYLAERRYSYGYREVFLLNTGGAIFSALASLFLINFMRFGAYGRIVGLIIPSAAFGSALLWGLVRRKGGFFDREIWSYLFKTGLLMLPQLIAAAALTGADRLMISHFYGVAELAKYSVAHSLGVSVCLVSAALGAAMRPWILRKLSAGRKEAITDAVDISVTGLCVATVILAALTPEAMSFLAPDSYSEAMFSVLPISLSVVPSFLGSIITTFMLYSGRGARTVIPTLASAALNVVLNLVLMRLFPYTVASVTALLCSCVSMLINYIICRRLGGGVLFSPLKVTAVFISASAIGITLLFFGELFILRLLILAIVILLALPTVKKAYCTIREL